MNEHHSTHSPHSLGNRVLRVVWGFVAASLRWTPRRMFALRALAIRAFGGSVGKRTHPYPSCRIWAPWNLTLEDDACLGDRVDLYAVGAITIGKRVVISQDAVLCSATHDYQSWEFPLVVRPIRVHADAWIAAGAFIGPGVTVGEGAVVGARAVVFRDVPAWTVVAGNPATVIGHRKRSDQVLPGIVLAEGDV